MIPSSRIVSVSSRPMLMQSHPDSRAHPVAVAWCAPSLIQRMCCRVFVWGVLLHDDEAKFEFFLFPSGSFGSSMHAQWGFCSLDPCKCRNVKHVEKQEASHNAFTSHVKREHECHFTLEIWSQDAAGSRSSN